MIHQQGGKNEPIKKRRVKLTQAATSSTIAHSYVDFSVMFFVHKNINNSNARRIT